MPADLPQLRILPLRALVIYWANHSRIEGGKGAALLINSGLGCAEATGDRHASYSVRPRQKPGQPKKKQFDPVGRLRINTAANSGSGLSIKTRSCIIFDFLTPAHLDGIAMLMSDA